LITANGANFNALPSHVLLVLLIALYSLLQLLLQALFSSTRGPCISLLLQLRETYGVSVNHRNKCTRGDTKLLREVERWNAPAA
jgi:hypothetical protein